MGVEGGCGLIVRADTSGWLSPVGSGGPPSLSGQKADKSALAAKVSRVQFDATTEQLNHMMQELVAKMSGQEQDWQKMLDRLLLEMDSKVGAPPSPGPAGPTCSLRAHLVLYPHAPHIPPRSWTAWSWTL